MLHGVVVPLPLVVHGRLRSRARVSMFFVFETSFCTKTSLQRASDPRDGAAQGLGDLLQRGIDAWLLLRGLRPVPEQHGELGALLVGEVAHGLEAVVLHGCTFFTFFVYVFLVFYNVRNRKTAETQKCGKTQLFPKTTFTARNMELVLISGLMVVYIVDNHSNEKTLLINQYKEVLSRY